MWKKRIATGLDKFLEWTDKPIVLAAAGTVLALLGQHSAIETLRKNRKALW